MIQPTSRQALRELIGDNKIIGFQKEILSFLASNPNSTDLDMSTSLFMEINVVTARRNELVEMGLVKKYGLKINATGKTAISWCLGKQDNKQQLESLFFLKRP